MQGQLNPGEQFLIDYQIPNTADSGTYFVRAVVTRDKDGVVIDTLTLDDQGGQYFKKSWTVPQDQTGLGTWISILCTVYNDAAFTDPSLVYGALRSKYIIQTRAQQQFGGGGMYASLSSDGIGSIREMFQKALKPLIDQVESLAFPDLVAPLSTLQKEIRNFSKSNTDSFLSVSTAIAALGESIRGSKPPPDRTDELLSALRTLSESIARSTDVSEKVFEKVEGGISKVERGMAGVASTQARLIRLISDILPRLDRSLESSCVPSDVSPLSGPSRVEPPLPSPHPVASDRSLRMVGEERPPTPRPTTKKLLEIYA
jgi:hypothetical protein